MVADPERRNNRAFDRILSVEPPSAVQSLRSPYLMMLIHRQTSHLTRIGSDTFGWIGTSVLA